MLVQVLISNSSALQSGMVSPSWGSVRALGFPAVTSLASAHVVRGCMLVTVLGHGCCERDGQGAGSADDNSITRKSGQTEGALQGVLTPLKTLIHTADDVRLRRLTTTPCQAGHHLACEHPHRLECLSGRWASAGKPACGAAFPGGDTSLWWLGLPLRQPPPWDRNCAVWVCVTCHARHPAWDTPTHTPSHTHRFAPPLFAAGAGR